MATVTPKELAERLQATGTGESKLKLVRESESVERALDALGQQGHRATVQKAEAILSQAQHQPAPKDKDAGGKGKAKDKDAGGASGGSGGSGGNDQPPQK